MAIWFGGMGLHLLIDSQHGVHDASCPICSCLAQAKVAGEYFAIVACEVSVSNDDILPQAAIPAAELRAFEARGPPAII